MLFRRRPGHEVKKNGLAYKNSGGSLTGAQYGCREGIKLRTGAQAAGTVRKEPAGGGKEKKPSTQIFRAIFRFYGNRPAVRSGYFVFYKHLERRRGHG